MCDRKVRDLEFIIVREGLVSEPDKYETDSDNESDEKGDFEVVYGRTCMARSGRSVRDRWCVWICENSALELVKPAT